LAIAESQPAVTQDQLAAVNKTGARKFSKCRRQKGRWRCCLGRGFVTNPTRRICGQRTTTTGLKPVALNALTRPLKGRSSTVATMSAVARTLRRIS